MTVNGTKKSIRLRVVDYERLKARDNDEIQKLCRISSDAGIFYLDLRGPSGKEVLTELYPIINAQRKFFAQSFETKLAYSSDLPDRGYEKCDDPVVESLELSREEQIRGTLKLPSDLQAVEANLSNVASFSDAALRDISILLCTSLDPPIPTKILTDPKNPGKSNLGLSLAAAPAGTALIPTHTDTGILTIVYYDAPFLELLDPATQEWQAIEAVEGLHVVNVGEIFQKLSDGRLKAAPHRVTQAEGDNNAVIYYLHQGPE